MKEKAELPLGIGSWTRWIGTVERPGPATLRERVALSLLWRLARLAAATLPRGGRRTAWRELTQTVASFRYFRLGATLLPKPERALPLEATVRAIRARLGLYPGLWAVEGIGFQRAELQGPAAALLGPAVTESLPAGSMTPLHVGAGLALARAGAEPGQMERGIESTLAALLDDIRNSSTAGCEGVGFEAIGLFVRTLMPSRLLAFDRTLCHVGGRERRWFWHGVGRALYFLFPRALFGSSDWQGWARAALEAPDAETLRPTQAGFVWALSLVNTGEPAALEAFLRRHGEDIDQEIFEHGVVGTTMVWHAWAGIDERLARLLEHRPRIEVGWEERVRQPVLAALEEIAPLMESGRQFARLFLFPFERP